MIDVIYCRGEHYILFVLQRCYLRCRLLVTGKIKYLNMNIPIIIVCIALKMNDCYLQIVDLLKLHVT